MAIKLTTPINSMKNKIKRLSKPLTILVPMIAVSFLTAGLAKADYRSGYAYNSYKKPSYGSSYKKPSSYYGKGKYYGKSHYGKSYAPKKYSVTVRLGNIWVTKYTGHSYSSAASVAKYYRSRGISVRF